MNNYLRMNVYTHQTIKLLNASSFVLYLKTSLLLIMIILNYLLIKIIKNFKIFFVNVNYVFEYFVDCENLIKLKK